MVIFFLWERGSEIYTVVLSNNVDRLQLLCLCHNRATIGFLVALRPRSFVSTPNVAGTAPLEYGHLTVLGQTPRGDDGQAARYNLCRSGFGPTRLGVGRLGRARSRRGPGSERCSAGSIQFRSQPGLDRPRGLSTVTEIARPFAADHETRWLGPILHRPQRQMDRLESIPGSLGKPGSKRSISGSNRTTELSNAWWQV